MEYLSCGDLQSYLKSPLTEGEAQCIVAQIIEGLKFMHDNDFVHRDLKPQVSLSHSDLQRQLIIMHDEEYTGRTQGPSVADKDCGFRDQQAGCG